MSATQKFFTKLFGSTGSRAAVPDPQQADGTVAYETGYGFDYQRAPTDLAWKPIERDKFNQILYDLTLSLRQYQTHGYPEFVQAADNGGVAWSYDANAYVLWTDGNIYVSLVAANTSDPSDTTRWLQVNPGNDVGKIDHFTSTTAPAGYVKANGALLSRTAYPRLWAFAQASGNLAVSDAAWSSQGAYGSFSPGDGASTFRIPDMRGYHVRAYDDGRGVDSGRVIGAAQADQLIAHSHGLTDPTHTHAANVTDPTHTHVANVSDPGHGHGVNDPTHVHPILHADDSSTAGGNISGNGNPAGDTAYTSAAATGITIQGSGSNITVANVAHATGVTVLNVAASTGMGVQIAGAGTETRVKTIALLACIKFQ